MDTGLETIPDGDALIVASAKINLEELSALEAHFERQPNMGVKLLKKARRLQLPIEALSFESEIIIEKISRGQNPLIVKYRNDLNHGNVTDFAQRLYIDQKTKQYTYQHIGEPDVAIFTPECLRATNVELAIVAYRWAEALINYYHSRVSVR